MNYSIQIQSFNSAAEKFVQFFERGEYATQAGKAAFMAMMKLAPKRVHNMLLLGMKRNTGLLPMAVTRPPEGMSFWEWVYSPADIHQRLLACTTPSAMDEMRHLLQDVCKGAGVSITQYPIPPKNAPEPVAQPSYDARLLEIVDDYESRLAVATDADEALYLHTLLAGYLAGLGRPVPDLQSTAPMVPIHAVNMAAVKARVAARLAREDADTKRDLDMLQAKMDVEIAIAKFGQDSDQARMAIAKAIQYLPEELKAGIDAKARELGLMPAASGYLESGDPVFTVEALANHFGMEPEQVMQDAGEFAMTVDASTIHRPQ